jgi:hypothetical protein
MRRDLKGNWGLHMATFWSRLEVEHCENQGCGGRATHPWLAGVIVVLVASMVLGPSTLRSMGVEPNATFATPMSFTYDTALYILGFSAAVLLGSTRRHESPIWCFVDSVGIPVLVAVLVGLKGVTH